MGRRNPPKSAARTRQAPAGKPTAPPSAGGRERRWTLGLAAVVVLAVVAAYSNSLQGVLLFDDNEWIIDNPTIRDLGAIGRVLLPLHTAHLNTRPVVNLTLALNYAVGETNVRGYHLTNLAIHVLAALTLFGIVRRTLTSRRLADRFGAAAAPLAAAVAVLWAVHPLQTQAVTYVVQRCESLMGLFYLLTLYCVIRGASSRRSGLWNAAAVAACVLGMGAKEVMATAPVVVLLYDRTFLSGSFRDALRARYGLYLGLAASLAVVVGLVITVTFYGAAGIAVNKIPWWSYLLTQPGVLAHYLRLTFWPTGLCLDYGWPPAQTLAAIVPPALLIVSLFGLTCWALVKHPAAGFLGAWFFLILAPSSSIVPLDDAAFDHRMYLSLAAVATAVVLAGYLAGRRLIARRALSPQASRVVAGCLILVAAVVLAALTRQRNAQYHDAVLIAQDTIVKAPDNSRAYLGLGNAWERRSRFDEAIVQYREALQRKPAYVEALYNLGKVLIDAGRDAEAIPEFEKALKINANAARVHYSLGLALVNCGRIDEGIAHYERALAIEPNFASAHYNLAAALVAQSRFRDAAEHYRAVLWLEAKSLDACHNLARILATSPDASLRNGAEAVELAQKAVQLSNGQQPLMLDTLAAAYAENGQLANALRTDRLAAELAVGQHDAALLQVIKGNIQRYEATLRGSQAPRGEPH